MAQKLSNGVVRLKSRNVTFFHFWTNNQQRSLFWSTRIQAAQSGPVLHTALILWQYTTLSIHLTLWLTQIAEEFPARSGIWISGSLYSRDSLLLLMMAAVVLRSRSVVSLAYSSGFKQTHQQIARATQDGRVFLQWGLILLLVRCFYIIPSQHGGTGWVSHTRTHAHTHTDTCTHRNNQLSQSKLPQRYVGGKHWYRSQNTLQKRSSSYLTASQNILPCFCVVPFFCVFVFFYHNLLQINLRILVYAHKMATNQI